jgi:signal transduction histidine kinase
MVGQLMGNLLHGLSPVLPDTYQQHVRYTLSHALSQQLRYPFQCDDRYFIFDLIISPTALPTQGMAIAVVIGTFVQFMEHDEAIEQAIQLLPSTPLPNPVHYQRLLTQIARNVRRTLDLSAIWKKAVDGLGTILDVDRCLICSYKPNESYVTVVGEHCHDSLPPRLNNHLDLSDIPNIQAVLQNLKPSVYDETEPDGQHYQVLAIATAYKDQANGLILLYQANPPRPWSELELELFQELASQIGTGIAHATLLAESQTLAQELQEANDRLRQKHRELEEAHKRAEEASRLKSQFLANTSHELRTPLNGMIGFLKLVMDGMADDPEEQDEFIREAYRSAVHLLNIINDILDIAKIEAGKMQLDLDPVNLDDLMNDVENFTRTQAEQKRLSFEIRTPAIRDPVILYGNYQRLLQVMLNLVGNAIKFTPEGGITISAEVMQGKVLVNGKERPGMAKISVADTGIGVSLEKQDKLFQNFSQIDGSRTRQYGGTGLGLAISQKLIEAMGGVVNFFSMGEGLGSTVTFTVPLFQDPIMISSQSQSS